MTNRRVKLMWLALLILAILVASLILLFSHQENDTTTITTVKPDHPVLSSEASSASLSAPSSCAEQILHASDYIATVDQALDCLLYEHLNSEENQSKQHLLALDTKLRELVYSVQSLKRGAAWPAYWQQKEKVTYTYQNVLGIYINDQGMEYDGRMRYGSSDQQQSETHIPLDQYRPQFERINAAFLAIPKTPERANIESLYELDEQLEELVVKANTSISGLSKFPSYREIGVYFDGKLYYDGQVRLVADKLLPPQGFIDPQTGKRIEVKGDRYSKLKQKLESISLTYELLKHQPEDAEQLYELSEEIDATLKQILQAYPNTRSQVFWENKYGKMGLYVGHYSDQLGYGDKLVVESYRLNPDSKYSEETMLAAISGAGGMSELSDIPDVELAYAYIKRFPNSKNLQSVYWILATFYQNLFEELLEGTDTPLMEGCYSEHLKTHPKDSDPEVARIKALENYKKLVELERFERADIRETISNLENRIDGNARYWCTD